MEKLKKINEYWKYITGIFAIIIFIWGIFNQYQKILKSNEEILKLSKTSQQMALKSIIWNDNIPDAEIAAACDTYLNAGYNSYTKKHCETVLNESLAKLDD